MMNALDVALLTIEDRSEVVDVWAESFNQYSVMRYIFKDVASETEYVAKLKIIMGFYFDYYLAHGWPVLGVRDGGCVVAALCASGPRVLTTPMDFVRVEQALHEAIGVAAQQRSDVYEQRTHQYEPLQPHYYVGVLGVYDSQQGRGLAGQLLKAIHAVSQQDPTSTGVCLFTETERNVGFYQYMGYELLADFNIEEGLRSWAYFRADSE